jgi:hypothetical protein
LPAINRLEPSVGTLRALRIIAAVNVLLAGLGTTNQIL